MHLHAAACVFESWSTILEYPEQVGTIRCCGRTLRMEGNQIRCDQCDTIIEREGNGWKILRVKGQPFPQKFNSTLDQMLDQTRVAVEEPGSGGTPGNAPT
jgi:hypothetical protein